MLGAWNIRAVNDPAPGGPPHCIHVRDPHGNVVVLVELGLKAVADPARQDEMDLVISVSNVRAPRREHHRIHSPREV